MIADGIRLEESDAGYELVVEAHEGTFVFNVHGCTHDLIGVGRKLADYWAEGRRLAAEHEADLATAQRDRDEFGLGLGEIDGGGA